MRLSTRTSLTIRTPLPELDKPNLERIARALAMEVVRIIRLRTREGLDENHKPFKPYSKEYARRRKLSGRDTDPKLQLTGQLMNGLSTLQVDGGTAIVGFGPKSDTAVQFRRIRTKSGKGSSRKLNDDRRATWTLAKLNKTITAIEKATYVESKGRRFFAIEHASDLQQLYAVARRETDRALRSRR